jgi:AmmeMemoRadiSam system protein B
MVRKPAVAGYFYPGKAGELRRMIQSMVDPRAKREKALAVISPHAGLIYSGPVAGAVFSSVELPDTFLMLGPAHRTIRPRFAAASRGSWETPLGVLPIDTELAEKIMSRCALVVEDEEAHSQEHSLEVQLPFIQYFKEAFSFVPICLSYQANYSELEELGHAVSAAVKEIGRAVLVVASTDMSHYVSQDEAKHKDFLAIGKILDLDAAGLYLTVEREDISMCGFKPAAAAVVAGRDLGASRAVLVKYQTSGDRTGDFAQVVGYAGLRIA